MCVLKGSVKELNIDAYILINHYIFKIKNSN